MEVDVVGSARGMVLTSRSVPRRVWERRLEVVGAVGAIVWSRLEESHDCWMGDGGCGCCGGVDAAGAAAGVG